MAGTNKFAEARFHKARRTWAKVVARSEWVASTKTTTCPINGIRKASLFNNLAIHQRNLHSKQHTFRFILVTSAFLGRASPVRRTMRGGRITTFGVMWCQAMEFLKGTPGHLSAPGAVCQCVFLPSANSSDLSRCCVSASRCRQQVVTGQWQTRRFRWR